MFGRRGTRCCCTNVVCDRGFTITGLTDNTTCGFTPYVNFNSKTALLTFAGGFAKPWAGWPNGKDTSTGCTSLDCTSTWDNAQNFVTYGTNYSGGGPTACGCPTSPSVIDPSTRHQLRKSGSTWTFSLNVRFIDYVSFQHIWRTEWYEWTLSKSGDARDLDWADSWTWSGYNSSTSNSLPSCSAPGLTQLLGGTGVLKIGTPYSTGLSASVTFSGVANSTCTSCSGWNSSKVLGGGDVTCYDSSTVYTVFDGEYTDCINHRMVLLVSETDAELYVLKDTSNYAKFTKTGVTYTDATSWDGDTLTYDSTTGTLDCDFSSASVTLSVS